MNRTYELRNFLFVRTFLRNVWWTRPLDLFFTSNPTLIGSVEIQSGFGDHDIVQTETPISPKVPRPIKGKVFPYSKENFTNIRHELLKFSSSFLDSFKGRSIQENWEIVQSQIVSLMEKHIHSKITSTRYNLPWYNQNLKKLNRKVQRLYNVQKHSYRGEDKAKHRHTQKVYKQKLNTAYWDYVNNLQSWSKVMVHFPPPPPPPPSPPSVQCWVSALKVSPLK